VNILHGARAALLVFLGTYVLSLAAAPLTSNAGLLDAALVLGALSSIGLGVASLIAVTAQLCILFGRVLHRREGTSVRG